MFDQDDDWDSPYEPRGQRKQQFQRARYAQASHKTSVLSIISMSSGLSALPGICMCFISVPLGLMATASADSLSGVGYCQAAGVLSRSPEAISGR